VRVIAVDPTNPAPDAIDEAATVLHRGGLVAFPTETVYGLGAHALRADAVRRIFEVKGRPRVSPLIVHVADANAAREVVAEWPAAAEALASRFWPGPLTLVLHKQPTVPDEVTAGLDTVGVRVPAHPVALALLQRARIPIAAPSANPFTRVSPTTADHVVGRFGAEIDLVLDGGPATVGIESTVVDLTQSPAVILRPGAIDRDALASVLADVRDQPPVELHVGAHRSPGMTPRHYAPRATVVLFAPNDRKAVIARARAGQTVGALLFAPLDDAPIARPILMPRDAAGYARALYAALHELEEAACELILIENVPDAPEWAGVADRLRRAAH
jgi:L-threonylcarbamoyladenylate synthase